MVHIIVLQCTQRLKNTHIVHPMLPSVLQYHWSLNKHKGNAQTERTANKEKKPLVMVAKKKLMGDLLDIKSYKKI